MSDHGVIHIEIPSSDPQTNAKFYAAAFDWKIENSAGFDYWLFKPQSGPGGGFPGFDAEMGIQRGEILLYIGTDDIEASLAKIESLGGKILSPKHEIPGMGWWAFFADPTGNKLGLYKRLRPTAGD